MGQHGQVCIAGALLILGLAADPCPCALPWPWPSAAYVCSCCARCALCQSLVRGDLPPHATPCTVGLRCGHLAVGVCPMVPSAAPVSGPDPTFFFSAVTRSIEPGFV